MIRTLALVACVLTVCITAASAFIRHSQAGLGCADWPRCYRQAATALPGAGSPSGAADAVPDAAAMPDAAAVPGAASTAVAAARGLHRLSAMAVGVLVLVIAVFGWAGMDAGARVATVLALADTAFLAWLGRYTPHDLPLVTVGNLVGGLALAAAYAWIAARAGRHHAGCTVRDARLAWGALWLLVLLAWVGTMIGARHAIDACMDASCFDGARFEAAAFDPLRPGAGIGAAAAQGLHLVHRALGVAFAVLVALLALRAGALRGVVRGVLLAAVAAQLLSGTGTAVASVPLLTATLHNALAAVLAAALAAVAACAPGAQRRVPGAPASSSRSA